MYERVWLSETLKGPRDCCKVKGSKKINCPETKGKQLTEIYLCVMPLLAGWMRADIVIFTVEVL